MKYRLAINGYGRIGRCVLRALYERKDLNNAMEIVAINEIADIKTMSYLTKYDSIHGKFPIEKITTANSQLFIDNDTIIVTHTEIPEQLKWQDLQIDLLLECSGSYKKRSIAKKYIKTGPKRLLFSQPAQDDVDKTTIFGVNDHLLSKDDYIVSNGSCTTNCLIPVLKILQDHLKIKNGMTTTIHSAMNDQPILDSYHSKYPYNTRSAMNAVVAVDTHLNKGIERIFPELSDCFSSNAIRVPTPNVSMIDLTVIVSKKVSVSEVNNLFKSASENIKTSNIIGYSDEHLTSVDYNHNLKSVIIDATQTKVCGSTMIKLHCWFDNEWGFSNRMLDTAKKWLDNIHN